MPRSGSADSERSQRNSVRGAAERVSRRGGARHLDGWQPGLLAVFLAGAAAVLAVPRPVEPIDLPMPIADARALSLVRESDAARARAAEQHGLDADVRELGSAFRAFGLVDANPERTEPELLAAQERVLDAAGPALAQGEEAVLQLRAYQLRSFLREVRRWEASGEESDELRELGGDFLGLLRRSGWLHDGAGRRVAMDVTVLGVLFKKRWAAIVGVRRSSFDPTLDEQRALFAFLLAHPIGATRAAPQQPDISASLPFAEEASAPPGATGRPPSPAPLAQRAQERRAAEQYRLKKIEELAAVDPEYPRDLARGVVLYRLGKFLPAVESFRRHIERFPDGSHALRARNYLRAALGRANDELF